MLRPYEEKIETIKEEIISIANVVVNANKHSVTALKDNNMDAFKDITLSTKKIANKSNEIDNLIVKTLALYSPEAKDLRQMVAFLKITNELVRAASNTKTFLKGFKRSFSDELNANAILEYIIPLQKASTTALSLTVEMLKDTNEANIEDCYNKVIVEESKTDDLYSMVEKNILKLIHKNLELSKDYFDLLSAFRKLDKTADRAASIANLIHFAHFGGEIEQS